MGSPEGGVPSLRVALMRARAAGATVEPVKATGEVDVIWNGVRVRCNARKKDANRALINLLKKAES